MEIFLDWDLVLYDFLLRSFFPFRLAVFLFTRFITFFVLFLFKFFTITLRNFLFYISRKPLKFLSFFLDFLLFLFFYSFLFAPFHFFLEFLIFYINIKRNFCRLPSLLKKESTWLEIVFLLLASFPFCRLSFIS